ncbi:MAG: SPOR domain-containing protein [Spirochaetaceae bacterium]|nr:SPOR domain-containing protein [Spirochaetaceae bacterium]
MTRQTGSVLLIAFLCLSPGLWAEEPVRTSYAAEIRELEGKISAGNLSPQALRESRERLALLFQFSGNIEGAAALWAGSGGSSAALRAAQCLAALGEWGSADDAVKNLLASARDRSLIIGARYLSALISAFRSGGSDYAMLASFLDDPDYAGFRARTCYFLWKFSGNPGYKTTLIQEYPASPEARVARDSGDTASPTALWLLYPGGENPPAALSAAAPQQPAVPAQSASAGQTAPAQAAPAPSASAQPVAAAQPAPARPVATAADTGRDAGIQGGVFIQTGLYGRRENAQAQAEKLRAKDFEPSIIERTVNGNQYWAVTIEPGSDYNHTILRLKDAGFESFPVFQ